MLEKKLKKFILFCLVALFLTINLEAVAFNNPFVWCNNSCKDSCEIIDYSLPSTLEDNIRESIANIYGEDQVTVIYPRVLEAVKKAKQNRPLKLYMEDLSRASDWYKDEIIYMFYVDQFGTRTKDSRNTFKNLIGMLDYLEDLGVTTIFMLPFIDSPMGDAGFDIRDPKNIRADLGGIKEFKDFMAEAKKRGFNIKSDLILNHFSDQHEWFQEALKGDEEKANYFVKRKELPEYNKYLDEKVGVVVEYKEKDGKISKRRLIFPDIVETHYRKVKINGEEHYFYHTFYPFQLDVNWKNPEVLYYMLDVLGFWANNGIDIFRMDAIPYYIKEPGTNAENLPKTHEVIKLLSSYVQAISPRSVIQAEACQWPKDILPYFGKQETSKHTVLCNNKRTLKRTDEVQIAYNFPYMPAIWSSMITGDSSHFWKAYAVTPEIPDTATWAVFLRVHDELTLEMVDIETRKLIYGNLVERGAEFRKGFGVSGRMANFLQNDPERVELAFSILLSMPGIPIIYYGDEIGAQNKWEYAKASEKQREKMAAEKDEDLDVLSYFDSRDINRGPITKNTFYKALTDDDTFSGQIYKSTRKLVHLRKEHKAVRRGDFQKIASGQENIFSYARTVDDESIIIVHNLSAQSVEAELKMPGKIAGKIHNNTIDLISKENVSLEKDSGNIYKISLKPYQSMWIKIGE